MGDDTHGIPIAQTAPAVFAERLTDLVGLMLLGAVGQWQVPGQHTLSCITLLLAVGLVALGAAHRIVGFLLKHLARLPWFNRRSVKFVAAYRHLVTVTRPYPLVAGVVLSMLGWGTQAICMWLLAKQFAATEINVSDSLVTQSLPLIAGALVLLPGGMGATEASMASVLQRLGGPGLTSVVAVALTIGFRVLTFWFAMLLGLASLAIWQRGAQPVHGRAVLDRS